jgi:hypothetical protein
MISVKNNLHLYLRDQSYKQSFNLIESKIRVPLSYRFMNQVFYNHPYDLTLQLVRKNENS